MAVDTSARTPTFTYVDGDWFTGNPPLIGPVSHAMWLGSTVFDGARGFDGIDCQPDQVLARITRDIQPGAIVLLHEGAAHGHNVAILARLLAWLDAAVWAQQAVDAFAFMAVCNRCGKARWVCVVAGTDVLNIP